MAIKTADSKGRIALGPKFANKTFIIEEVDATEFRVIAAAVIPEREMWLHKSEAAMAMVQRGLQQAAAGEVVPFDPHEDDALLEELDG
jgi:predicted transcriptional regulator